MCACRYFDKAVTHRFVRFKIGEQASRTPGGPPVALYRICQITSALRVCC